MKKSLVDYPLISIITATFNAVDHLPRTIKAVRELTYQNIEWIIVDGNSSDATVDLFRQNEDIIDYWVSEPDGGIYDAWNKGVSIAKGEWISFLGAGDTYKPGSINAYIKAIQASSVIPDLVSSRVQLVTDDDVVLLEWGDCFDWDTFQKYMNIGHPGALHNRILFEKFGHFDTIFKSSADYDFLMRCGKAIKPLYLNEVTVNMIVGGISDSNTSIYETYAIQRKYVSIFKATYRYWFARTKRLVRPFLRGY
jgi:glycosyltransferase involved in cell wall biosynthesis